MVDSITLTLIAGLTFFIGKFVEMRFIKKEVVPLKDIFKDSLFVFVSVNLAYFIVLQFAEVNVNPTEMFTKTKPNVPTAFTGQPDF